MTLPPAIETRHLCKTFGEKTAVSNLTLTVEPGEVFGFLGPNGAGKTTSVKMLLGLITPTSGEGCLFGIPLGEPAVRERVGFLPEHFRFHDWLTAQEFLTLHAELYVVNFLSAMMTVLTSVDTLSSTSVPSPLMVAYAGLYLLVAFTLAVRSFQRRDL